VVARVVARVAQKVAKSRREKSVSVYREDQATISTALRERVGVGAGEGEYPLTRAVAAPILRPQRPIVDTPLVLRR
jgi:hypothetical protein